MKAMLLENVNGIKVHCRQKSPEANGRYHERTAKSLEASSLAKERLSTSYAA